MRILALCIAALAALAALVAALGPAHAESARFSWPAEGASGEAGVGLYAPLPLLNRVPASLEVDLPCDLARPRQRDREGLVLATSRRGGDDSLRIDRVGATVRISIGTRTVATMPWPASCPAHLEVAEGELRLPGRTVALDTDTPGAMPIVTGLFTDLDLSGGQPPSVGIQTRTFATSWTGRQVVAGVISAVLLCAAIGLLAWRLGRRDRPPPSGSRASRRTLNLTDALVVGVLLVWWIVAPTFFDDGWIALEHQAFRDLGTLNVYLDSWGVTSPFGYWFVWPAHWVTGSTNELVLMRVPALLVLVASWFVCRWCLTRVVPLPASSVRWALAGAFLIGATAWGMTLRPEPLIALLALVSLAAVLSFAAEKRADVLGIAVAATIFAVTLHPIGTVVAAPLLAALPDFIRWLRRAGGAAMVPLATVLLGGVALLLLLVSLDADVSTRLEDARIARTGAFHDEPFWREYVRYSWFDESGAGTQIRRLSLSLLLLTVAAWLTRRRSAAVATLPARSVAVGLVLLAMSPSKWPWHFGVLAGIGAIAVAAELARLEGEPRQGRCPSIRQGAALLALGGAFLWSWQGNYGWGRFDLQETAWPSVFSADTSLAVLIALAFAAVWGVWRANRDLPDLVAWATVSVSFTVVGFTIAVLAGDAAVSGWSPARQNLEALVGRSGCGLADKLGGDDLARELTGRADAPVLIDPPVAPYFPCTRRPALRDGLIEVPRLVFLLPDRWLVEERDGPFSAVPDLYTFRSVARWPRELELVAVDKTVPGFLRSDALVSRSGPDP